MCVFLILHEFFAMWIVNSYTAKVLVWLAAALMPGDMLLAGTCGCGERGVNDAQGKSAKTYQSAACCCHGCAVCQGRHQAEKVRSSACCKNRTGQPVSSRNKISQLCVCPGGQVPASQTTLPDSSAAKQIIGHAWACLGLTAAVGLSSPSLSFIGNCPSLPATPLERLSTLCRFII